MKNVHVLPTDRPSGLFRDIKGMLGFNTKWTRLPLGRKNQHIYITNNEEPKDGEICITFGSDKCNGQLYTFQSSVAYSRSPRKIILTTDLYLIKNGVQAIDDEFLEWFVKNPSCERVEVDLLPYDGAKSVSKYWGGEYKIIIPKEEPKQETPEEAAEKQWGNVHRTGVLGFIEGANWQAQRMYSEEEVLMIISSFKEYLTFGDEIDEKEWFEQFKKK